MDPNDKIPNPSRESPRSPSTIDSPELKPSIDFLRTSPSLQSNSPSERLFKRSPACSEDRQLLCERSEKSHLLLISNLNRHLDEEDVTAFFSEYGRVKNIRYYYDLYNCFNGKVDIRYWHITHAHAALKDIKRIQGASGEVRLKGRSQIKDLDSDNEQL